MLGHSVHMRRLIARAALSVAALTLAVTPFSYSAMARADYDSDYFNWCMENVGLGAQYCCEQAGGVLSNETTGSCGAVVFTPAPPTVTQIPGPPVIIAPRP